nr:MAG TPA: hypothetical protein [Caudoviricetes sp.]
MKFLFHIFPIKSRLFPLNPVYSPALGILFDGLISSALKAIKSLLINRRCFTYGAITLSAK